MGKHTSNPVIQRRRNSSTNLQDILIRNRVGEKGESMRSVPHIPGSSTQLFSRPWKTIRPVGGVHFKSG